MNERWQGFLSTMLAGTIGAQHGGHNASPEMAPRSTAGPWQPSDEVDPTSLRGGRGPPCRTSSHVVRDNSSASHIERKCRRKP